VGEAREGPRKSRRKRGAALKERSDEQRNIGGDAIHDGDKKTGLG
jgi:hypothetical protein